MKNSTKVSILGFLILLSFIIPYLVLFQGTITPEGYILGVYIDDSDSNFTWEKAKTNYGLNFTGTGTVEDPIIVKDTIFDSEGGGNNLVIQYSSRYFKFINCTFRYSGIDFHNYGIKLWHVSNGQFINITIHHTKNAIHIEDSQNLVFDEVITYSNSIGFRMYRSTGIILRNSFISYNDDYGIGIIDTCENNWIYNNTIAHSENVDIIIGARCNNTYLSNNEIYYSQIGIMEIEANHSKIINNIIEYNDLAIGSGNSEDSLIENNTIAYNEYGIALLENIKNNITNNLFYENSIALILNDTNAVNINYNEFTFNSEGIQLNYTSDIEFYHNLVMNNTDYGVSAKNNSNSLIYYNLFINNSLNAFETNNTNNWDNSTIGNYWDDYSGSDLDYNGIGDIPYIISGTANSQDRYPIINLTSSFEFIIPKAPEKPDIPKEPKPDQESESEPNSDWIILLAITIGIGSIVGIGGYSFYYYRKKRSR